MRPIPRAELPEVPNDPTRWCKVVRAVTGHRLTFISLADELFQCYVHWDAGVGRNFPCFGKGECSRCGPHAVRIWQAYLSGASVDLKSRFVVEITQGLARRMKAEGLLERSLYGKKLIITRKAKNNSRNGAVILCEHEDYSGQRKPARLDPLPSLLRLWTWNEEHYDKLRVKMESLRIEGRKEVAKLTEAVAY